MSQFLDALTNLAATADPVLAANPVPEFTPDMPGVLEKPTGKVLAWTAGGALSMAVLGGLTGWGLVAIGHNSERPNLAARGKSAIIWSLIAAVGIGVTSGLVLAFYDMAQGG